MQRLIISCLAVSGLTAMLQADAWNKKTELTVNESIQVPGATLTPGKYVVKLVDSQSNRNIVQFTNEEENRVISTVVAIPNQRLEPTGDTEFSFYEGTVGGAPALRAWFYPGDTFGQQFAYPEQKAMELARATGEDVPAVSGGDPTSAGVTTASPDRAERTTTRAAEPVPSARARTQPAAPESERAPQPDPTIMAQAQQPEAQQPSSREGAATPPQQQPSAAPSQLPATASPAPLLGLLGLLSLGGALGLRALSSRKVR